MPRIRRFIKKNLRIFCGRNSRYSPHRFHPFSLIRRLSAFIEKVMLAEKYIADRF